MRRPACVGAASAVQPVHTCRAIDGSAHATRCAACACRCGSVAEGCRPATAAGAGHAARRLRRCCHRWRIWHRQVCGNQVHPAASEGCGAMTRGLNRVWLQTTRARPVGQRRQGGSRRPASSAAARRVTERLTQGPAVGVRRRRVQRRERGRSVHPNRARHRTSTRLCARQQRR